MTALTAAGAVVFAALLWVAFKTTVETMLPELRKPGVPVVVLRTEFKVVLIKPLHISRLELDGNTTGSFPDIAICYIISVSPSITEKQEKTRRLANSKNRVGITIKICICCPPEFYDFGWTMTLVQHYMR